MTKHNQNLQATATQTTRNPAAIAIAAAALILAAACSSEKQPTHKKINTPTPPVFTETDQNLPFMGMTFHPLAPEFTENWFVAKGKWNRTANTLEGQGDAQINLNGPYETPFILEFKMTVVKGDRPQVIFGKLQMTNFSQDGRILLGLFPIDERFDPDAWAFQCQRGKEHKICVLFKTHSTVLYVDGKPVAKKELVTESVPDIKFAAGNMRNPGQVIFRDIAIKE